MRTTSKCRNKPILALVASTAVLFLSACKPPATDDYVERVPLENVQAGASVPIDSPDTANAVWVESDRSGRIIYGEPGSTPLMALACQEVDGARTIHITRFASSDPQATALIALIGNGHMSRLPIDAAWNGRVWLWEGYYPASNLDLNVLAGPRRVEATIPGAGSIVLNPSQRPAQLIAACRRENSTNSPQG